MSAIGVEVWIDGGWGVDALLGEQTRSHKDLDIAVQEKHVPLLRELLLAREHREVRLEDARPWNFVLGDPNGREIDVHASCWMTTETARTAPQKKEKCIQLHR